jgi:dTDP-4-amino-4,6-dideoxygalactose transaminase
VITVSSSFIATANVIKQCGASPVFVDIRPDDFNLDPDLLIAAFTDRTRAVLCVHQMGMPCDLERMLTVTRLFGVPLIEDAACATGSEILVDGGWQPVGAPHGDVACFSFHPRKVITTGEGGMITTRHADWDRKFRLWRQHGMSVPDTVRHHSAKIVFEDYPVFGFNYRMTDMQAAIGRRQLERLPKIIEARGELAARYRDMLCDIPGLVLPHEPAWARSNWQSYCVRLPSKVDQVSIMQSMLDEGVATRRGIMCAHLEAAHSSSGPRMALIESERARDQCILLPLYPQMDADDQAQVVSALRHALGTRHDVGHSARGRELDIGVA